MVDQPGGAAGHALRELRRGWDQAPATPDVTPPGRARGGGSGERRKSAVGRRRLRCGPASGAPAGAPGPAPRRDQAYAVLRIDLTAPVAEGTSKGGVLDRGYIGHYTRTAGAGQAGNFALAGHRNTHGEPFRHIDRLRRGDRITVETRDAVHTYTVDRRLVRTAPSDSGVIAPVPRSNITTSAGYGEPGYHLILTTCTPEFSSCCRLIVWGQFTSIRPRRRTWETRGRTRSSCITKECRSLR
ncbi:class E sortase [Streptomyces sp. NPDC049916]|uniref:class E sortase n=1 Tax=Streptomyces sp. NPDC049916 TaxID=3155156 RepID=UPI00341672ED